MKLSDTSNYDLIRTQCGRCANLTNLANRRCIAFPDGIPKEIWSNQFNHTRPYQGDNGIRFAISLRPNQGG